MAEIHGLSEDCLYAGMPVRRLRNYHTAAQRIRAKRELTQLIIAHGDERSLSSLQRELLNEINGDRERPTRRVITLDDLAKGITNGIF